MSEQPKKRNAVLPPPRAATGRSSVQGATPAARHTMKERHAKAMTKLIAAFGPEERAEYESLKQMRMKKKKRR